MDKKIDLITKDIEYIDSAIVSANKRIDTLAEVTHLVQKNIVELSTLNKHVADHIGNIDRNLERNTNSLIEHMRRTEINELNINSLKDISVKIDSRLDDLEAYNLKRDASIKTLAKLGALIGGMIGAASLFFDLLARR